jgi:acyl-CoA synthetase (AMP-forming)/AMP-acid ligase II
MTEHSRLAGQTLWDLIDARVAATPDAVLAVDETGRRVTFAEYAEAAERAAAGFAAMGIGEGSVVTWQLPTWIESLVLVAALSRLGAVQNPVLPIYREREVALVTAQASARPARRAVGVAWVRLRGDGHSDSGRQRRVLGAGRRSPTPDGDPSTLTPVAPSADAIRWLFTPPARRPTRRVPATPTPRSLRSRPQWAIGWPAADDRSALVFPFTHIGGITWLFTALQFGCSLILMEAFHPTETPEVLSRNDVTLAGSGTPFHMAYLAAQKAASAPIFPSVRGFPGGERPSRRSSSTTSAKRSALRCCRGTASPRRRS